MFKEVNDVSDFQVIDLSDISAAAIKQYYSNDKALDKLLSQLDRSKSIELGIKAAL